MANTYYRGLDSVTDDPGVWGLEERWPDVERIIDLRANDEVLDVGCAEGLVSFEVAKRVRFVRAIELEPDRVSVANRLKDWLGVQNVAFEVGSITTVPLEPRSYDVVLFLGVFHHLPPHLRLVCLEKCLRVARRQLVMRTPVERPPRRAVLEEILAVIKQSGFDGTWFPASGRRGGNLILANRQPGHVEEGARPGADARFQL